MRETESVESRGVRDDWSDATRVLGGLDRMDPLFEAKLPDDREELVSPVAASVQQPPPPQPQRAMRRENDSMDDFEHLEHDGSQLDEAPSGALDVTSVQLIDLPRAAPSGVSDLMDVASKLERNILDTSIPVDERILQPVPATPPPSASFEKFDEPPGGAGREAHALHHRFDGQQDEAGRSRYSDQRFDESPREDAKAATMAFMETERAIGDYHGGSVDRRPEDELGAGVATQRAVDGPAGDPVSMEDYRTREHELGVNSTVVENEPESSSGKARLAPDKSAADVDELLAGADDHRPSSDDIAYESSGVESACRLPSAGEAAKMQTLGFAHGESKRSSDYDFLGDDGGAPGAAIGKSESSRNVVDDDTWNVVEKPELQKRSSTAMFVGREADETAKVERELFEAPTKPLPPLPKAELDDEDEDRHFAARNERVNDEKFVMSDDFMTATETSGPRGQKSRGQQQQQQQSGAETGDSEFESAPEQSPAKSSTRTAGNGGGHHVRKINADDIAPKEIFAQMGLGKSDDSCFALISLNHAGYKYTLAVCCVLCTLRYVCNDEFIEHLTFLPLFSLGRLTALIAICKLFSVVVRLVERVIHYVERI